MSEVASSWPYTDEYVLPGWVYEFRCNAGCSKCDRPHRKHVKFGNCYPLEQQHTLQSIRFDCNVEIMHSPVITGWKDSYCGLLSRENYFERGPWLKQVKAGECYPSSFFDDRYPGGQNGQSCANCATKAYKYLCHFDWSDFERQNNGGELRAEGESIGNSNTNFGIAVAVLLLVCLMGVIAGCLINKRRKSTQKISLSYDANKTADYSYQTT